MQKFEQAVSYIENGEAEKGLQLLKEQLKIANDEERYDIARYIIHWDLRMKRYLLQKTYVYCIQKKVNSLYF